MSTSKYRVTCHLNAYGWCPCKSVSRSEWCRSGLLGLDWSQVTHIPTSIKSGGAYKPEKSAFYSTFARQLCDDTRLPGWLSAFPPHPQIFKLTQASFAHTNSQPSFNELENLYSIFVLISLVFLSVGGFLKSSAQPHESAARPLQRAAGCIKGTRPPLLISVPTMGKCKQANEFQLRHYGHPTSLIIHEQNLPDSQFKVVYLNRLYAVDANWRHTLIGHETR